MNLSRLWIFFSAEFGRIEQSVKMNCTQKNLYFQHLEHLEQLVQINNVKIKRWIYRAQINKKYGAQEKPALNALLAL